MLPHTASETLTIALHPKIGFILCRPSQYEKRLIIFLFVRTDMLNNLSDDIINIVNGFQ